jgi:hypothetical protein
MNSGKETQMNPKHDGPKDAQSNKDTSKPEIKTSHESSKEFTKDPKNTDDISSRSAEMGKEKNSHSASTSVDNKTTKVY